MEKQVKVTAAEKGVKTALILNKGAGTMLNGGSGSGPEAVLELLVRNNVNAELFTPEGGRIAATVTELLEGGFDTIIAGGGDGTISAAASALAGTKAKLGVIPLGTLNHFAKDLNIPLDAEEAVKVIAQGKTLLVDAAEVNGNLFINNSSIGLYPKAVKHREKEIDRLGGRKWVAMGLAMAAVFKRFPSLTVKLSVEEKDIVIRTPFVFVGNNEYQVDIFNLGSRERLDKGLLSLYYPLFSTRISIIKFTLLALVNRLHQTDNFEIKYIKGFSIDTVKPLISVSLDGEVKRLTPPLNYSIKPEALTVIIP